MEHGYPRFDGHEYDPQMDNPRLGNQMERVSALMSDGGWRTLAEIAEWTGDPEASISAQLRHLRKVRFGSWIVKKQSRGGRRQGLWEYQLLPPVGPGGQLPLRLIG